MGDNKYLKDVIIQDIIQSIQTEYIKPGSQDTNTGLLEIQSASQWSEGIHTYSTAIAKNKYEITNMVFTAEYSVLVHHLNSHLEKFSQTPQGTSFTNLLDNWDKSYVYGYNCTNLQFYQLITTVTAVDDNLRQVPGYNKVDDTINGRTTEIPPHLLGLSG